jgi:hypothetical protein
MIRADVHEEIEDKICHFYSRLHTKIQDIVDYKEYDTVNYLFQLAMLAKTELQGHQPTKMKASFTPHSTSTFLDDNFGFTSSFHIVDTFYNITSRYGPE